MGLLVYSIIVVPDVAVTSLLIDEKTKNWEIFAFYFWFLISVGLAILFLMSAGSADVYPVTSVTPLSRLIALTAFYLELAAIPSTLVLLYRRVRVFLVFIPMPLLLGYALVLTSKVVGILGG
ncbi:hypothetical protein [Archaeoglobus neptunius]|uniref:hypothetical protein n=1 Tax=Archaeoglobus neptunius TaxID=2798580 RepID=UPI0019259C16|nr:hypothetical protein [Archaeoglobus neptunius]